MLCSYRLENHFVGKHPHGDDRVKQHGVWEQRSRCCRHFSVVEWGRPCNSKERLTSNTHIVAKTSERR